MKVRSIRTCKQSCSILIKQYSSLFVSKLFYKSHLCCYGKMSNRTKNNCLIKFILKNILVEQHGRANLRKFNFFKHSNWSLRILSKPYIIPYCYQQCSYQLQLFQDTKVIEQEANGPNTDSTGLPAVAPKTKPLTEASNKQNMVQQL